MKKQIKGKIYLYLEERAWINGKSRRTWQKYLGPEETVQALEVSSLLSKSKIEVELETIEFGISAALWKIANEIDLAGIIDSVTNKSRDQNLSIGEYIKIATINRCVAPCSKSKLATWFENDWLATRYDIEPHVLNAQTYWNHFHYLGKDTIEAIEQAINKAMLDKFKLDTDSLFFDPTNFYTFSKDDGDKSDLRQNGHSKEGRNNLHIVNYSLLCLKDSGIPIMHETYAGNEQDAKAFKRVPDRIAERLVSIGKDPRDVTLVFDKGNHSKVAFEDIDEHGFYFIASARNSMFKDLLAFPRDQLLETVLPLTGKVVKYHKTTREIYGRARTVYVVLDPAKHAKHSFLFQGKVDAKVREIEEFFKTRLNHKKWERRDAVEKKLKSMIGKKPMACVVVAKVEGNDGKMRLTVTVDEDAKSAHEETLGRSILFTNRDDWEPETVIWGYREQYVVEHAFARMKSPTSIAVRPMYHRSDDCIKAHVFTCVLALLLLALLRLKLAMNAIQATYDEILDSLRTVHVVKVHPPGGKKEVRMLDVGRGLAKSIVNKLKLERLVK